MFFFITKSCFKNANSNKSDCTFCKNNDNVRPRQHFSCLNIHSWWTWSTAGAKCWQEVKPVTISGSHQCIWNKTCLFITKEAKCRFRLKTRDDYYQVTFDHFWGHYCFWSSWEVVKIGSSLKPYFISKFKQVKLVHIRERSNSNDIWHFFGLF